MGDTAAGRPVPHGDDASRAYWEGAAAGRLRLQRCAACGLVRHYPQLLCARCHSTAVEAFDASGQGTVHSWTVAHHAFHPAFREELPYTLVTVDLPEGPRSLGRLDPAHAGMLRIGLPVVVSFPRDAAGTPLPVWRAAP